MLESPLPQHRGELPGKMQSFAQLVCRWHGQNRVGMLVCEPVRTSNHATCKPRALRGSAFVEVNKDRVREAIDARFKTADTVAQSLR